MGRELTFPNSAHVMCAYHASRASNVNRELCTRPTVKAKAPSHRISNAGSLALKSLSLYSSAVGHVVVRSPEITR